MMRKLYDPQAEGEMAVRREINGDDFARQVNEIGEGANYIKGLVILGCRDGFDGALCDEIIAEGNRLYAIQSAADSLTIEAEVVGTTHGYRELLDRVGQMRQALA